MVRWSSVLAVVFVLVVGTVAAVGLPTGAAADQRSSAAAIDQRPAAAVEQAGAQSQNGVETGLLASPGQFTSTTHRLTVYANGSVRWTDRHTRPLENDSEIDAYEAYAADFNSRETELYTQFRRTAAQLTATGAETTGRPMNASHFSRRAYVAETGESGFTLGTQGVVEMSFMWSNFTQQSGRQLRIGDLFTNGLSLGPDRRLVVETSDDLQFVEVDPEPDSTSGPNATASQTVAWTGEHEFSPYRPLIRLAVASADLTATETPGGTDTSDGGTDSPSDGTQTPSGADEERGLLPWLPIGVVVLIVTGGAGGVWYLVRHNSVPSSETTGSEQPQAGQATETEPIESDEILSDDNRVKSLLEDHGGRMRQSEIVEATGWSKSKVSMLLSDMEDEDEITKIRVGRENIVSLPGHEPDAAGSPFEDDQ
ncbi:helix-turn-helix transcriptional regulator [Halapricum desulfuricans]|uniref:Putative membrane-associated or secreted trancriptional regulator n=1 Tax=Halapricum desulfuricans TaxID=2841257 RepID=A0A897NA36_9EURY|nr:helix-turn-helix domain-containing protein [Halapricum desulfuricans]QSG09557.1 putative membrane-associated or secreted trancriptional regulator [Halapricum desulfuricans]